MKDLTKGRPSVLILTFALPIFLANLLQLTYSLADTRIVGTFLGDNALAAVGATTTLSNLIVQFLMGMCNGFAIISAQCFGAKDMDRLRRSLGNSLVLGLLATVVLTFGGLVFLQPILRFLNVPENLLNTATQYCPVRPDRVLCCTGRTGRWQRLLQSTVCHPRSGARRYPRP